MSRDIRMVPENWEHPTKEDGSYIPLYERYKADADDFMYLARDKGLQDAVDYMCCPDKDNYMPDWSDEEKTHFMMYETTTEGTPISPAFKTIEELAKWLADNGASAFGSSTATYEQWLATCKAGGCVSAAYSDKTGFISGVELANEEPK